MISVALSICATKTGTSIIQMSHFCLSRAPTRRITSFSVLMITGCCGFGQSSWTRGTINGVLIGCSHYGEVLMLVRQFKFKRNHDKGAFQWTAESEIERPGFYRGFHARNRGARSPTL